VIRLLLVDDSPRFLQALQALVDEHARGVIEVVGTAANGEQAVELAGTLEPDVISMDLQMPVMDGLQATRRISLAYKIPIVILSGSQSSELAAAALDAGAFVQLDKSTAADAFVPTVIAAAAHARGTPTTG
jgi:two-component system chemotaxis response regulator CheB